MLNRQGPQQNSDNHIPSSEDLSSKLFLQKLVPLIHSHNTGRHLFSSQSLNELIRKTLPDGLKYHNNYAVIHFWLITKHKMW